MTKGIQNVFNKIQSLKVKKTKKIVPRHIVVWPLTIYTHWSAYKLLASLN
jgi:hypothetical protein